MKKMLFTGQMMLAYNQDRKTATRRVVSQFAKQPDHYRLEGDMIAYDGGFEYIPRPTSPHQAGDVVVLASTWAVQKSLDAIKPSQLDPDKVGSFLWYDGWVDDERQPVPEQPLWMGKKRPGRYLPKTLYSHFPKARIVSVKLEPVQAITEAEAIAEGVEPLFTYEEIHHSPHYRSELDLRPMPYTNYLWHGHIGKSITGKQSDAWPHQFSSYSTAVGSFSSLWQKINGPRGYGWDDNPLVWAYTLEPIRGGV